MARAEELKKEIARIETLVTLFSKTGSHVIVVPHDESSRMFVYSTDCLFDAELISDHVISELEGRLADRRAELAHLEEPPPAA